MHCRSPTKDVTHAIRLNACSEPDTVKEGSNTSKKLHFVKTKELCRAYYLVDLIREFLSTVVYGYKIMNTVFAAKIWRLFMMIINHYF